MIYEIGNPSDAYTCEANDDKIAAAAILLLGSGVYTLKADDSRSILPPLVFMGEKETEEWLENTFGAEPSEFWNANADAIADCLESVLIGSVADRHSFIEAVNLIESEEGKQQMRKFWQEKHRTSLNDIGKAALQMASVLRQHPEVTK